MTTKVTDCTHTAGTIQPGDRVNDDQTFDRILIHQVNPVSNRDENGHELTDRHITFFGTRERAGDSVIRCWPASVRVVMTR